ncbi:uncharacterized protein BO80DRAFT_501095 [Aspergillus ibericus CBS 121593]|uniref:Uncharacterized protein n=1 Tax=Aspergillus ibericus CBS 121593 TaxID=1448316 RepID=A0A395H3E0_9EURO|nr:hypothetical protein BO80DRAFT_501095 [Aspergillus ibericus CBS 121593]RAL02417.1 hypothetical protein BO80DRAFT_501095 [Aspergillus ibericus CBS 121593]
MRWTSDNDQLLLLMIIETHDLRIDTKRVAAAWPTAEGTTGPTPRAITERLVKLRQTARESGVAEGSFSIGKGVKNPTPASTPRKSRKGAASATPKTPSSGKRKRVLKKDDSEEEQEKGMVVSSGMPSSLSSPAGNDPVLTPTKGKGKGRKKLSVRSSAPGSSEPVGAAGEERDVFVVGERMHLKLKMKGEGEGEGEGEEAGSPAKRVRKASVLPPGMINWQGDGGPESEELESLTSEYLPDPDMQVKGEGDEMEYA